MNTKPGSVTNEQLLAEVEDLLRTIPSNEAFGRHDEETIPWLGRALAAIDRWNYTSGPHAAMAAHDLRSLHIDSVMWGLSGIKTLLYQARADLRMQTGQVSVVVQQGQVFAYFDELRKVIETARSEVLFVDPYLEAEFVARYLPHVAVGVTVRLLAGKRVPALLSAVEMFVKQSPLPIEVRSSSGLHDRYLFVDRSACYLSGASFKDGAKNAPVTLTQITDAFQEMWDTYERLWNGAKIER